MINLLISNVKGECIEYSYTAPEGIAETINDAMVYAVEQYIHDKFGGFGSKIFPITQSIWVNKIKKAVESVDEISVQDKIDILNSICRNLALKITKVKIFTGCSVKYPPTKLTKPTLSVNSDGNITWTAVANASGYKYSIDGGVVTSIATLSITAANLTEASGKKVSVKAIGNNEEYLDSDFAEITYSYETGAEESSDE